MPSPAQAKFYQWAVYWPFLGYDRYGQPTIGPPQQIPVAAWNTKRRKVVAAKEGTIALDGTAVVFTELLVDSHIWLGTIEQWYGTAGSGSGSGSAAADDQLMVIKLYNDVPDIRNRYSEKTIGLMRLHNASGD